MSVDYQLCSKDQSKSKYESSVLTLLALWTLNYHCRGMCIHKVAEKSGKFSSETKPMWISSCSILTSQRDKSKQEWLVLIFVFSVNDELHASQPPNRKNCMLGGVGDWLTWMVGSFSLLTTQDPVWPWCHTLILAKRSRSDDTGAAGCVHAGSRDMVHGQGGVY